MSQVQQTETCQVTARNLAKKCWMSRVRAAEVENIVGLEILHADRFRDALVKSLADFLAGPLFKDGAQTLKSQLL